MRAGPMAHLKYLHPATLRDLAAAIEARSPRRLAHARLTPAGIERITDILLDGATPTVGLFRRHSRPAEQSEPT